MMGSILFVGVVVFVAVLGINRSNRNARYKNYGNRYNSADSYFFTGADPNSAAGDSRSDDHRHNDGHSGASTHHGHHNHSHGGGSSWDSGSHHGGWDSGGHGGHGGDSGGGGGDSGGGGD
ncbi:hypothetical protein D3C75_1026940 [compost metagenome]